MPLDSVVGTIVDEQRESIVQWIIPNYVPNTREEDNYLQSPPFHFLNRCWCLRFYPNGDSQSVGSFAVYLVCENTMEQDICLTLFIGFRLSLMGKEIEPSAETYTFNNNDQIHKKRNLAEASLIWDTSNPTDIQIDCIAQEEYTQSKDHDSLFCTSQFSCDFMDLVKKIHISDATIELGDFNIPIHMLIFAARSSKFKEMFTENIREKTRGFVKFDDFDIFTARSFVDFIYTGTVESNAAYAKDCCLYKMAAEYDVTDLKLKCAQIIEQKMCNAIACDVLEFAEEHSDSRLKKSAERFLIYNIDKILSTSQWKTFVVKNESLAKEILTKTKWGNNI